MAVSAKPSAPPSTPAGTSWRWAQTNLFSSPGNAALTIVAAALIGFALFGVLRFVLLSANWDVISVNRRLFFLGRFPSDETWRVWVVLLLTSWLAGASWGLWSRIGWPLAAMLALGLVPVFLFIGSGTVGLWTAGTVGLFSLAYFGGRSWLSGAGYALAALRVAIALSFHLVTLTLPVLGFLLVFAAAPPFWLDAIGYAAIGALSIAYGVYIRRVAWMAATGDIGAARQLAVVTWVNSFLLAMYLLNAVDTLLWGGLLLTMILTIVGIAASFPLGVLLALGRQSTFPIIRLFCIGYIELIRGVPLITILFMAFFFLPLMLEPERNISFLGIALPATGFELDIVARAMVAITLFSAAYLAETVRGGLQAVPRGQIEAAQALGLSTVRMLALIVLPQALRAVIPAIVGQFISLFKDTSLVAILALTELLGTARQVTAQPAFFGTQAEVLLFVALIYWIIAFSMSRASQRLEHTLGVGER